MSLTALTFAALLLLALLGAVAGIVVERQQSNPSPVWRRPAVRDAVLPIAGWASLFVLDLAVALAGEENIPVAIKHLLGTLALLLLYYAVLSTLRLVVRSLARLWAHMRSGARSMPARKLPVLGALAFPTLFVSAVLATLSVLYYDGVTQNLAFIAGLLALIGIIPGRRLAGAAATAGATGH